MGIQASRTARFVNGVAGRKRYRRNTDVMPTRRRWPKPRKPTALTMIRTKCLCHGNAPLALRR